MLSMEFLARIRSTVRSFPASGQLGQPRIESISIPSYVSRRSTNGWLEPLESVREEQPDDIRELLQLLRTQGRAVTTYDIYCLVRH